MNINQQTLKTFRKEFEEAVKELEAKHNIKIKLGNIRFDENDFRSKLEVVNTGNLKSGESAEKAIFNSNCRFFGLNPEDYNKSFTIGNKKYSIIGIKPSARKKGILLKDHSNGRTCITSFSQIANLI